ncbi:MAG: CoA transferase [Neomegalonema sp.]|nr:CoA transferase [Neomegalonema sp.]
MREEIQGDLFSGDISACADLSHEQVGASAYGPVSELAYEAVASAALATQRLCYELFQQHPRAVVDKELVDLWCGASFVPDGWRLPPKWDPLSGDYRTADGWIRLHCNAPHHRTAALLVLGSANTTEKAQSAALSWRAHDLENAIVAAGGCAAELLSVSQWRTHTQGKAVAAEPIVAWTTSDKAASSWRPRSLTRPLSGLRVLDLTRIIAGPVATRFLASLGADVLRIDPPGWEEGANEIEMTVGKTCAELDLKHAQGRDVFVDLLQSAHVVVDGYRRDALTGLGFGSDRLAELNPALISVGLTAYGWTGPWRNRRGFDSLVQRSTGLAVAGESTVFDLPYQALDHATGYLMAAAAIEALRRHLADNTVSHARLSLARQAMMLLGAGVDASIVPRGRTADREAAARQRGQKEETSWGGGWRCPLPYQFEGMALGWSKPAHKLRSELPRWSNKEEFA